MQSKLSVTSSTDRDASTTKETRQPHIPGLNKPPRATTAEAAQSSTRRFAAAECLARLLLVMLAILARGAALQGALQACGS